MRDVTSEEAALFQDLMKRVEGAGTAASIPWPTCLDCGRNPADVWLRTEDVSTIFTEARHVVHMRFDPCGHTFRIQVDPIWTTESA